MHRLLQRKSKTKQAIASSKSNFCILLFNISICSYHNKCKNAYQFYCAQSEGQQTKHVKIDDKSKQCARMTMTHFPCKGRLQITREDLNLQVLSINFIHCKEHIPYVDISIPPEVVKLVKQMKEYTAAQVCELKFVIPQF